MESWVCYYCELVYNGPLAEKCPRCHASWGDERSRILGQEVLNELSRAQAKFAPFNSAHEGYAVILEELDELWEEIRKKRQDRDPAVMRAEAIQVAAMAMRFVLDVCERGEE